MHMHARTQQKKKNKKKTHTHKTKSKKKQQTNKQTKKPHKNMIFTCVSLSPFFFPRFLSSKNNTFL